MSFSLVRDFLEVSAQLRPHKLALVCDGRRLSYSELDRMTSRMAHGLIQAGIARGDRVAVFLPNSVESVVSIFAVLKASAAFVMINPGTKREKLRYLLRNCRASALIASADTVLEDPNDRLREAIPSLRLVVGCGEEKVEQWIDGIPTAAFAELQSNCSASSPPRLNIDLDLACLIYTSGSTGEPKGVMSDHSNVVFASNSIIRYLQNVESDVVINVLPLSFDYGLYQLLMTFQFGGTLVLERSYAFPATFLHLMEVERVTGFPGVPTIFALLLKRNLSEYDLSSLRYVTNTAAALPPAHVLELKRRFPRARVYSMYGLTETKRALFLPPEEVETRPSSVGVPIPGTEVWIEDEEGNRLESGEVGELVVRGRHVMRGYWESPEATAKRFRPGPIPGEQVCHTGDLFRRDSAGFYYFVGRKDDIIKSRGEKVAPKEVENVLYELPGILGAVVIGVPDAILGQSIRAILVLAPGSDLTKASVLQHCRARLEDFMVPKEVEFRESLPSTPSGKISRKEVGCAESLG